VDEYVSGGYYLARMSPRAEYMSPDLLPERVLSGSPCICDFFPDDWTIEWTSTSADTRVKDAASFGISSPELPAVVDWATKSVE